MLTQDKTAQIAEYLNADESRAEALLNMTGADAAASLQADGIEVTAEDLREFADSFQAQAPQQSGELDEDALESVSGGRGIGELVRWAFWKGVELGQKWKK